MRGDAYQFRKSVTAHMTGRADRGRDRAVRRHSFDIGSAEAQPGGPIGDGSYASFIAHQESIVAAAEELQEQQRAKRDVEQLRAAAVRHAELEAALARVDTDEPRAAQLRRDLAAATRVLQAEADRLREGDVKVLKKLLRFADRITGRCDPSLAAIAAAAARGRTSICDALRRLHANGFLDWRRRSRVKDGAEGQFGPQREQTSSNYLFDWARALAPGVRLRFEQLLARKLRRLGKPLATARPIDHPGRSAAASNAFERRSATGPLAEALARFGGLVDRNAST